MELQKQTQQASLQLWKNSIQQSNAITIFKESKHLLLDERTNSLTIGQAINSGAHFAVLKKWNEPELVACIAKMLIELMNYVPNNLSSEQVVFFAKSIIEDNPDWKPDDVLLIMREGKRGTYGKMYGNFSYQTFNEWADKYHQQRQEFIYDQHTQNKESSNTSEAAKHLQFNMRKGVSKEPQPFSKVIPDENYFKPNQ